MIRIALRYIQHVVRHFLADYIPGFALGAAATTDA